MLSFHASSSLARTRFDEAARLAEEAAKEVDEKKRMKMKTMALHVSPVVLEALRAVQAELDSAQGEWEAQVEAYGHEAQLHVLQMARREKRKGWGHMRLLALLTTNKELAGGWRCCMQQHFACN